MMMICVIRHLALTVSDVCLKLGCFHSTGTYSALEVSHFMCCINPRLTYLLTNTQSHHQVQTGCGNVCDWNAGLERHEAKYSEDDESTDYTRGTVDD